MAAAYAALVSLFNNLELIQTNPRHSFSFDNKQIQSLLQVVCFLIDFMETSDYHGGSRKAAEVLERQIASATHAAEDVIESHVVDQIHAGSTLNGKKRSWFMLDVQKVTENMEFVRRKAVKVQKAPIGFKSDRPTLIRAATSSAPLTSSDNDKMVGFVDVLRQLVSLLTGDPSSRQVIPIVGTGGIGKTTLAKNAFQHALIVEHFHSCLWVTISQEYDVSEILSKLLSSDGKHNDKTVGELGKDLHQSLYGKRYLIVLDDMWSVKAWDMVKRFFPDTRCGSRIIVTSRQSDVANHFGSLPLVMSFMGKEESWDLFCQKAFAEQSCPLELEEVGRKIVEKCRGLPLAIVVVGGHLRMSPATQEYWENVANHMMSGESVDQLFDVLYLSYSYLPVHLKPCFLYMGVFPEDKQIFVSELMWLWIGEGFLKPHKDQTPEEVAEGCLNDLISRNLILADEWSLERKSEKCMIHDVLRELCIKIGAKEKFFCVFDTSRSMKRERRIVINQEEAPHVLRSTAPLVRSQIKWESGCPLLFDSKLLRIVLIEETEHVLRNVNLRYVCGYFGLNSSISLLWNLQTLIVKTSVTAPYEIWQMTQLRHLLCERIFLPDPHPSDKENDIILRYLQTLTLVFNLRLSDELCKRIPNIKQLSMEYSSFEEEECDEALSYYPYNFEEEDCDEALSYCPYNLGRLHKLESLGILVRGSMPHVFWQALILPSSLKKVILWYVKLDWEELTLKIGSLPLLDALQLSCCKTGAEWNPVEGGFPSLRVLEISFCFDLTNWNVERSHFPVLEHLSLNGIRMLNELASDIGEISTLERIDLRNCSLRLSISAVRIVVEQEENGNDKLQLHVQVLDEEVESFNKMVQEEGLTTHNLHVTTMYQVQI